MLRGSTTSSSAPTPPLNTAITSRPPTPQQQQYSDLSLIAADTGLGQETSPRVHTTTTWRRRRRKRKRRRRAWPRTSPSGNKMSQKWAPPHRTREFTLSYLLWSPVWWETLWRGEADWRASTRGMTPVNTVGKSSRTPQTSPFISDLTLERNLTSVINVSIPVRRVPSWPDTWRSIQNQARVSWGAAIVISLSLFNPHLTSTSGSAREWKNSFRHFQISYCVCLLL